MISIVFGTNNSLRARAIRWATRGLYSHVWLEYPSSAWGSIWAAHATDDGVVKEPAARVRGRYRKFRSFEVRGFPIEQGMQRSHDLIGRAYDFAVIWNALLLVLFRATKWQWLWTLPARNLSKLTCSEFVTTILQRAGLQRAIALDAELTSPANLFDFCISNPSLFRE